MEALPVAQFTSKIIHVYRGRDCAPSTIRQIKQVLREFSELQADGKLVVTTSADLTDDAISAWKQAFPERTPVTIRSHLRCLHAICAWAISKGYLEHSPFERFRIRDWSRQDARPAPPRRQWSIGPDETRRVLLRATQEASRGDWQAGRLEAFIYALFLSGARPTEVRYLQVADFDPTKRTIGIHAKWIPKKGGRRVWWRPKTEGSAGVLPIGDGLTRILWDWQLRRLRVWARDEDRAACDWLFPGDRCQGPWYRPLEQVIALGVRAGVPSLRCKAGRKGLGTHKAIGLTPMERREYFRQADIPTGDAYDDEHVESMRGAAAKIERFYLP
jgi:integrase